MLFLLMSQTDSLHSASFISLQVVQNLVVCIKHIGSLKMQLIYYFVHFTKHKAWKYVGKKRFPFFLASCINPSSSLVMYDTCYFDGKFLLWMAQLTDLAVTKFWNQQNHMEFHCLDEEIITFSDWRKLKKSRHWWLYLILTFSPVVLWNPFHCV